MLSRRVSARLRFIGAILPATLGLSACIDLEAGLAVRQDGATSIEATVRLDPEMQDVFGFAEAVAQIRPEIAVFTRNGLCPALEFAAALNPEMKMNVRAKQGVENERLFCAFDIEADTVDNILRNISPDAPITQIGILKVTQPGARRVRVDVDLGAIPDFTPDLAKELARGALRGLGSATDAPDPAALEKFARLGKTASVSMTKLVLRDRTLKLTISAPKIVETNGVTSGQKVTFSWPWTEVVDMAMQPQKRTGRRYFVVIEY
ncbi:MAG TPA: hypothetical protein PK264_06110 [Hyphomicrobiaceae bacterium]|nr:hypothetical protein [Hyphomicrobiaceae bacterium]